MSKLKVLPQLSTDLVTRLENLGPLLITSQQDLDSEFANLRMDENYGCIGLSLQEKIGGDMGKESNDAFMNALAGGRSDVNRVIFSHQGKYEHASTVPLPHDSIDFINANFGRASHGIHFLSHLLNAFNQTNVDGLYVELWSPTSPRNSKNPLVFVSQKITKNEYEKEIDARPVLYDKLCRLVYSFQPGKVPVDNDFPFFYVGKKSSKELVIGMKQLVNMQPCLVK